MHPNERILREADEAQAAGDLERALSCYSDDVVVHIPGRSSFAGTYEGKDRYVEVVQRFMEGLEFTFEPHAYFADDEHGVVLQRSHYKRGDETFDSDEVFVMHLRDGKVVEEWSMSADERGLDDFLG